MKNIISKKTAAIISFCLLNGCLTLSVSGQSAVYTDLHDFGGITTNSNGSQGPDGTVPACTVALDAAGNLFGTAAGGGAFSVDGLGGIIWKITTAGTYTDLWDFSSALFGPHGNIVIGSNGFIWGTCEGGTGNYI